MLFQIDSDTQLVAPLWEVSSEAALNKALKDLETLSAEMMKDKPDYIIYVVGPKDEGSKEVGMFTAHQPVEFVRWVNPNEQ